MKYAIISDGCCDLTRDTAEKYKIRVIPFYISFDGENYHRELVDIGIREVYERMVKNPDVYPKTSLPSVQNYIDVFLEYVEKEIPLICICFTPALSGSYGSACNARDIVLEDYPDAKIAVINSECATVTQALFVLEAAKMRNEGIEFNQCVQILEDMKETNHIFFTIGDTSYLKHGGRIGKLAGVAASALSLKPLITLEKGVIESSGIGRSRKKTVQKTLDLLKEYFKKTGENPKEYIYAVGFGYDEKEGHQFFEKAKDVIHELVPDVTVPLIQIGATIACHTGPYAIGVGILRKWQCYE